MRISDWSSDVCSSDLAEVCNSLAVNSFRRFGKLSDQPRSPPKAYEKHRCENCSPVKAIRPPKPATHAITIMLSAAAAMHCSAIAILLLAIDDAVLRPHPSDASFVSSPIQRRTCAGSGIAELQAEPHDQ